MSLLLERTREKLSHFSDLLDLILPNGGTLAVLAAYFDASQRSGGIFAVAGFAFAKQQVKKFEKEWLGLFGEYGGCHMKNLAHGAGAFKGLSNEARGKLLQQAIATIDSRVSFGVAVSCDMNELNRLLPTWIQGFEHAYPVCCHLAMTRLGMLVKDEGIAYFFESGDVYDGCAHRFMGRTANCPELKAGYLHKSHTFIGKNDAVALQAADVFAWEWAKYIDETVLTRKRLMRKSLMEILGRNRHLDPRFKDLDPRFKAHHLTGAELRPLMAKVAALGLAQVAEKNARRARRASASSASKAE